jgi:hypothetical protein
MTVLANHCKIGNPCPVLGRYWGAKLTLSMPHSARSIYEYAGRVAVIPETAIPRDRRSALGAVHLTDAWAVRKLLICVRRLDELTEHAKRLVQHLRSSPPRLPPNTQPSSSSTTGPSGRSASLLILARNSDLPSFGRFSLKRRLCEA